MEYRLAFSALIQNSTPASFVPGRQSPICTHRGGLRFKPCQHGQSGHCQHRCSARFHRRRSLIHTDRDRCKCVQRDSQRIGRQLIPAHFNGWNAGGEPGQDDHVYRICSRGLGECLGHGHGYGYRRNESSAHGQHDSQSCHDRVGKFIQSFRGRYQCDPGFHRWIGRKFLYSSRYRWHSSCQPNCDHHLHRDCDRRGRIGDGHSDSHGDGDSSASPPTVTISANPTAIIPGGSSLLTVTATNATQVTVTGSDGSSYTLSATGGPQSVSPAATTTYTATAKGAGGSATATATVTVTANPPPTVTILANPTAITPGGSSTLTVTASNATQVTISGSDGTNLHVDGQRRNAVGESDQDNNLHCDGHGSRR